MPSYRKLRHVALLLFACCSVAAAQSHVSPMTISIDPKDGSYFVRGEGLREPILHASVAAQVDNAWLRPRDYKSLAIHQKTEQTPFGDAVTWDVTCTGRQNAPELHYRIKQYALLPFAEVQVSVVNTSDVPMHVQAFRMLEATGQPVLNLGAGNMHDLILSDSYSEDIPPIRIRDLQDAENSMHRGAGSQLIYNRESGWSFFAGTLSTDRFITLIRLHLDEAKHITCLEAEATGTTEITQDNSLSESDKADRILLSLPLKPNETLDSERLTFSVGKDYHLQLQQYGAMIKTIYHARTTAPSLMGWWSWTAFYYGLNQGAVYTNALWLAQNLLPFGYDIFHLDEGYQYARGEYTTSDAALIPSGMRAFEARIGALGLTRGIWTAPFEVSERSSIFLEHKDWLVHNLLGQPIHLGWANNHHDRLYALDTTRPEAQDYLRKTYRTLVYDWGIRYIKLDFMDDSGVEGVRFRPNTSAMEAQRIGLQIIREAVGNNVYLDKDGSPMLNPVGYVDYGRTGQDTGHTFTASKEAATAIAARYYMHRNFFVNDPDAFTASTQTVLDHPWNGGKISLTLEEAKLSIALSAISGGMFEIGDDLPTLGRSPERVALLKNRDLLAMVKLGRASTPIDLMTFRPQDQQPSIFYLPQDDRQSMLAVFNWTDKPASHVISLSTLGLPAGGTYLATEIFTHRPSLVHDAIHIQQPAHSVRLLKLINSRVPDLPPHVTVEAPTRASAGENIRFAARSQSATPAVLKYTWQFGDGTSLTGTTVEHTYTQAGVYRVTITAETISGRTRQINSAITVQGSIPSAFVPQQKERLPE